MRYSLAIGALLGATSAHATSATSDLAVETDTPDALCPDLASTRDAIRSRLGTLSLDSGQEGWSLRYSVVHAPGADGDFVRLELKDSTGTTRLLRDLPREGAACATLSRAIALVVERYFRELSPGEETPEPAPPEAEPSAPAPLPPAAAPSASPLLAPRFALGVSGGYISSPAGALVAAHLGAWAMSPLHLELSLLAPLSSRVERVNGSELGLRSYSAAFAVGLGVRRASWDAFAGPQARLTLQLPRADGLRQVDTSAGQAFSTGILAGLNWWRLGSWGLLARASVDYQLASTRYQVQPSELGAPRDALTEPAIQGLASVGLIWGFGGEGSVHGGL